MNVTIQQAKAFQKALLLWHEQDNERELPWKGAKDLYAIWLSEILLQQTRALQGLPYYEKFLAAYPAITDLANAHDDEVFKLWQGLGYYNRCKNMLATARHIRDFYNGQFPTTYDEILVLKGVGPYTAAAIASFGLQLPYPVIDGNVYRVLSRVFAIETPIDSRQGKVLFTTLANQLLAKDLPHKYNQAIMDLGAIICTPQKPQCLICPLSKICLAKDTALVKVLPVKEKRIKIKERWFNYFVLIYKDSVYLQRRNEGDIWSGLYEFYLIETGRELFEDKRILDMDQKIIDEMEPVHIYKQQLTHQLIHSCFYTTRINKLPPGILKEQFVKLEKLPSYAFPKTIVSYLERKDYF